MAARSRRRATILLNLRAHHTQGQTVLRHDHPLSGTPSTSDEYPAYDPPSSDFEETVPDSDGGVTGLLPLRWDRFGPHPPTPDSQSETRHNRGLRVPPACAPLVGVHGIVVLCPQPRSPQEWQSSSGSRARRAPPPALRPLGTAHLREGLRRSESVTRRSRARRQRSRPTPIAGGWRRSRRAGAPA